ncbi:MAG: ribosome biogenesis/translation initiation ATPase RLI [Candidatus Nanoarchaeia archaeon]|nr:ribosome biogenesis/translation initiation ATPase RLI [Candidatus Nanoarchaeia archaeon]
MATAKRIVVLKKERCKPEKCGDYPCKRFCPRVRAGDQIFEIDKETKRPIISESMCVGCGICVRKCPFDALFIANLPAELDEKPVHQYGKNSFRVYRIPFPMKGKVVGLIGQNAIGKSTIVKILSGVLKPNLGDFKNSKTDEEIIKHFSGTEVETFFKELYSGKPSVSYKPQYIDEIPKMFKGKIRELLEKSDKNKKLKQISEKLNITSILDKKVDEVSGGELQKIAIASTILKDSDYMFFDEPASYLDVKERLRIAQLFRELADSGKGVMVIEHDLIILDYMTDDVHLLYGQPDTYGVVALPKPTRTAINTYLEGYLKEENIRLRTESIKFEVLSSVQMESKGVMVAWNSFIKKYKTGFKLSADSGSIAYDEIIGILGPNAIGKSTFMKVLAGEIKPDEGEVNMNVKISYKPQYIRPESNETVEEYLSSLTKDFYNLTYIETIIKPLDLKPLLKKKLNELSGGELQRVSIASCLSIDAQLYLLDEPSAYLDVEQRLGLTSIIKKIIQRKKASAIIIDHDLLFLDYLTTRLIVFKGIPGKQSETLGPVAMKKGMDTFLKDLGITFRRDPETKRPRANKPDSQKDREQKSKGDYYYLN